MEEYSRILIEEYCSTHNSAKARRLQGLVDLSYDIGAEASDSDAVFLEKAIGQERSPELRAALKDLDDFLFGW